MVTKVRKEKNRKMSFISFFRKRNESEPQNSNSSSDSTNMSKANNSSSVLHTYAVVYGRRIDISTPQGQHDQQILKQCEIIKSSAFVINESDNLEKVLKNSEAYERALIFLTGIQDDELNRLQLKASGEFANMYATYCKNKDSIINSAILRAYEGLLIKISLLKTEKAKINRISAFVSESLLLPNLSANNATLLKSLPERYSQTQRIEKIKIQRDIFIDCANLINTSCNLEEVMKNIDIYENIYNFIIHCSPEDLQKCKLSPPSTHIAAYEKWMDKKENVINKAIKRAVSSEMNIAQHLENEDDQWTHMNLFFNSCLELPGLLTGNITFLKKLQMNFLQPAEDSSESNITHPIQESIETIKACEKRINFSSNVRVVIQNLRILTETLNSLKCYSLADLEAAGYIFTNGSPAEWCDKINSIKHQIVSQVPERPQNAELDDYQEELFFDNYELYNKYSGYSEKYNAHGSATDKLQYCEKALKLLPDIILADLEQDGKIISIPDICYIAPEMYMRIGQWEKAIDTVKYCIKYNAYYSEPELAASELSYIETFKNTASIALEFIKNNPGFLQKNMYKALSGKTDHDCLQHFLRCSEQILKEKCGSTNKLFAFKLF